MIFWNQHVAVIRNNGAITEIAHDDTPFVNTKQLIEVRVAWIIEGQRKIQLLDSIGRMQSVPKQWLPSSSVGGTRSRLIPLVSWSSLPPWLYLLLRVSMYLGRSAFSLWVWC